MKTNKIIHKTKSKML